MNNPDSANLTAMLKAAYQAFNARDIDAALSFMHPEVDWANGMEGGWKTRPFICLAQDA